MGRKQGRGTLIWVKNNAIALLNGSKAMPESFYRSKTMLESFWVENHAVANFLGRKTCRG